MKNPAALFVDWLVTRFRVPPDAVHMLRAAGRLSGLTARTLPRELVPLNARELARGVLNFTVLQSVHGWVFPYWAERQYDPADPAFIPRAHLGLSVNLTHRNWTAVGNPDCPVEPIVDPRGMVTPVPELWSLDVWVRAGTTLVFPSPSQGLVMAIICGRSGGNWQRRRRAILAHAGTSFSARIRAVSHHRGSPTGDLPRTCPSS